MAKKKPAAQGSKQDDQRLWYIHEALRPMAVRVDSLNLDPNNLKDHGEQDLPTHAESLRQFGIRRLVVVRRENSTVEAGNGTCLAVKHLRAMLEADIAAGKVPGSDDWLFVPVLWCDDDESRAAAFAAADNMIATLAPWNLDRLQQQATELGDLLAGYDMDGLLQATLAGMSDLNLDEDLDSEGDTEPEEPEPIDEPVEVCHKVIVYFQTEEEQINFVAEMNKRGLQSRLMSQQVKAGKNAD